MNFNKRAVKVPLAFFVIALLTMAVASWAANLQYTVAHVALTVGR